MRLRRTSRLVKGWTGWGEGEAEWGECGRAMVVVVAVSRGGKVVGDARDAVCSEVQARCCLR